MGREVRMVPADWVHPRYDENHPYVKEDNRYYLVGRYISMFDSSYEDAYNEWKNETLPEWMEGKRLWDEEGFVMTYDEDYSEKKKFPIKEFIEKRKQKNAEKVAKGEWADSIPENPTYENWWAGTSPKAPMQDCYMPNWPAEERTHYMMYETTSEGTPISPAFATPEELARWLAETGASTFADYTATYDQWLKMIVGDGWAPSAVIDGNGMRGGVEALNS